MPKRYPRVLIAGGGIGGLAAALALLRRGIDVDVYEQALVRYVIAREERTAKVVHGSAENMRRFQNRATAEPAGAQEYVDREWSEEREKSRYEWLFLIRSYSRELLLSLHPALRKHDRPRRDRL